MDYTFLNDEYVNNGGNLIILCGPPACGKTTLAYELKDKIPNSLNKMNK